jgi:hypothetical protein
MSERPNKIDCNQQNHDGSFPMTEGIRLDYAEETYEERSRTFADVMDPGALGYTFYAERDEAPATAFTGLGQGRQSTPFSELSKEKQAEALDWVARAMAPYKDTE